MQEVGLTSKISIKMVLFSQREHKIQLIPLILPILGEIKTDIVSTETTEILVIIQNPKFPIKSTEGQTFLTVLTT